MVSRSKRQELRRRLKSLRAGLELSQLELAERAGISQSKYWRIENGYDTPTSDELKALAKALRIDASQISQEAVAL
jgi:transcriptional regulator with XRE-family HTH domain